MKIIGLLLSFVFLLTSCKKEEQATIIGTWIMIDVYAVDEGVRQPSSFAIWQDCAKDDEWTITATGETFITEGLTKCSPESNGNNWYEWDKAKKQIIFNKVNVADILELTSSSLIISPLPYPNALYRQVRVYRRKS